jgi:hypothetical protein
MFPLNLDFLNHQENPFEIDGKLLVNLRLCYGIERCGISLAFVS